MWCYSIMIISKTKQCFLRIIIYIGLYIYIYTVCLIQSHIGGFASVAVFQSKWSPKALIPKKVSRLIFATTPSSFPLAYCTSVAKDSARFISSVPVLLVREWIRLIEADFLSGAASWTATWTVLISVTFPSARRWRWPI
jgi:hypothetical protein